MSGSEGHVCPECGTRREPDGTPSCACTRRASDAARDARTAEAAAAEDFDPLRIRPYVELGTASPGAGEDPGPGRTGPAGPKPPDAWTREEPATRAVPLPPEGPAERTMPLTAATPVPAPAPAPEDVRLFQEADPGPGTRPPGTPPPGDEPPRRRRRTVLLTAAGAAVAVVAVAALASGVLSYDTPERDGALPDAVRASVPQKPSAPAAASPSRSRSSAPASPDPTASESAGPSPSKSSSPSATPSPSKSPKVTPTTARATGSVRPPSEAPDEQRGTVLRRGDQGSEVTELQLRLRQLAIYNGGVDGTFSRQLEDAVRHYQWTRGISSDELGVYGTATRTRLESETPQP
ncbi:peptidoglycan-binding domain-containing protein [Streptomyces sp. NPDC005907]|uniref:peptidoglycan-binding domain-containing protein n=1 Tax=Streptomyces sp. NPDC005907 TaxID=3154571 RepID=UPI0033F5BAD0